MPATEGITRRQCIPIVYTRGTHFDVGFDVGRTFSGIIQNYVNTSEWLNENLIPAYKTPLGKKAYEDTLTCVKNSFPQYVRELEGTAEGANIPFYKLFLLQMDRILTVTAKQEETIDPIGCSSISLNQGDNQVLGHTEDALNELLNNFYFVSAHIISDKPQGRWNVKEERFTSLCYAGQLPGYAMNYNHHGLVFSINTIFCKDVRAGKIPRTFLTRALLAAENFEEVQHVLRDSGCGAGDGCSINLTFLRQEGDRLFHNIEMAPPANNEHESQLNVLTASPGENLIHCNTYLRIPVSETDTAQENSNGRLNVLKNYQNVLHKANVIEMLGDESGKTSTVFQICDPNNRITTLAVGVFDCVESTWSIYADNPRKTEPLVVLPFVLKCPNNVSKLA